MGTFLGPTLVALIVALPATMTVSMSEPNQAPVAGSERLAALIEDLGSSISSEKKASASEQLRAAGAAAIPLLIRSLGDHRVYQRRTQTGGDLMNRPVTEPPKQPRSSTVTVGERCEELLYQIITPVGTAEPPKSKVFSEQILRVDDWPAWWAANRHKTLAAIHAELTPLVDEYWRRHGTTQVAWPPTPDQGEPVLGVPVPAGSHRVEGAGGATTLGPGRNYQAAVYDADASLETITRFYARHLPDATQSVEQSGPRFTQPGVVVELSARGKQTRIKITVGPR